ncbi:MAG: superoxide dismutase [Sulfurihydrogenibium sp.]|uniref:Superoxide dismutase n=2 Tax=Sulfurihydrogenibium TaxID=212790 RepID=A0A831YE66_9AQUI|nr:MAG: superoxide dismutase [Sulfurihydrogenibium sp.]PMP77654.1 MAG: superoxide dismutase [Sulfurihydrogenibium sp.]HEV09480.1 superoxide dismutase [Sulfurihydrogenibium azorense]
MDRRDFLKLTGISLILSNSAFAMEILEKEEKKPIKSISGGSRMKVIKLQPKDHLKPKGLVGISDEQIEVHFEAHYKGYVAKYNEIQEKLATDFADRAKANQNYSEYRALKVEESFNYMGVVLHELYFENLIGGGKGEPSPELKKAIEEHFGSVENCLNEIKATGMACRGWATLSYDMYNKMLFVNGFDAHNQYGFVYSVPLIVLDVYEHAYYVDQKNKRPPYIDAFFKNLNWDVINERFNRAVKA